MLVEAKMIPLSHIRTARIRLPPMSNEVADFRRSGQSNARCRSGCRAVALFETDFLMTLELHHPAVVDHQLDRAVPDRTKGLPELPEERLRQRQVVV
jgi:hypothetical protein